VSERSGKSKAEEDWEEGEWEWETESELGAENPDHPESTETGKPVRDKIPEEDEHGEEAKAKEEVVETTAPEVIESAVPEMVETTAPEVFEKTETEVVETTAPEVVESSVPETKNDEGHVTGNADEKYDWREAADDADPMDVLVPI